MSDRVVQRYYRFHAHVYDHTRWVILHGRRRAAEALNLRPNSQVLEIGCGTGLNFRHLLEPLDPGRGHLIGLDFSAAMLKKAARCVARHGWPNVELIQADATTLDLGHQFDAIFFGYSLALIPNWRTALIRARDHLKPTGTLGVLEFGCFDEWGPLAPLFRGWLRINHVETVQPYEEGLRAVFPRVDMRYWLGHYNFIATARKGH